MISMSSQLAAQNTMKRRTPGFLKEFTHHALRQVLQEGHMVTQLVAPVFTLHVAAHLHGVAVADAMGGTIPEKRKGNLSATAINDM